MLVLLNKLIKRFTMKSVLLAVLFLTTSIMASNGLKLKKLNENVYAIVGELNNRTVTNFGNNSTHGFIITNEGIILIDSGGTYKGAKAIHDVIKTVSKKPIKIVINTGGQDHRWFGNSYFKENGAMIIASNAARLDHKDRLKSQLIRLEKLTSNKTLEGTSPVIAKNSFDSKMSISVDNMDIEIYHEGAAHTPGDSFVWIPKYKIMFTGDIVYTQRMLGIGSQSDYRSWINVFEKMAKFKPEILVPGHGEPTTLKVASHDTYNYLKFIHKEVSAILEDDGDMFDLAEVDQSKFDYLFNYDKIAKKNIGRAFTQLEESE